MDIKIKRMSSELAEDYFDFFDHRAFSDNSPYYPCYCNAFQMTRAQIETEFYGQVEANGGGEEGMRLSIRKSAQRMVRDGVIDGYLAYDGDTAIGWCNANAKNKYVRVGEFDLDDEGEGGVPVSPDDSQKIKAIVCFEIAPEYRGKGIAAALLERVCIDARKDGYEAVEAYPILRESYEPLDFTGPMHLYEKAGFTVIGQQGKTMIMQKNFLS